MGNKATAPAVVSGNSDYGQTNRHPIVVQHVTVIRPPCHNPHTPKPAPLFQRRDLAVDGNKEHGTTFGTFGFLNNIRETLGELVGLIPE